MAQISLISNTPAMRRENPKSNTSESTCQPPTMESSWSDVEDEYESDRHSSQKRLPMEHSSMDQLSIDPSSEELPSDHSCEVGDEFPIPVITADYNQLRRDELRTDTNLSPLSNSFTLGHTPFSNSNLKGNSTQLSMDSSFIFVKPEFNCKEIRDLTRSTILDSSTYANVRIAEEFVILAEDIEKGKLIDTHYKTIAENAMQMSVKEMRIPQLEFKKSFKEDIDVVIKDGRIFNAEQALTEAGMTPEQLNEAWQKADHSISSTGGKVIKFRHGLYCAKIQLKQKKIYVINGFYMALRRKFTHQHESIYAFVIHWDSSVLAWNELQTKVIGALNPADAECGSIRKTVFDKYEEYGLTCKPDVHNNVVHSSASPLQGLLERCNWLSREIREDEYGQALLKKGVPESIILSWAENHQVQTPSTQSDEEVMQLREIFDIVKGLASPECTQCLVQLYDDELFGQMEQSSCLPKRICCIS